MPEAAARPLRVLQVGKYYWPYKGGIETVVKTLSEGLRELADVEVLVANHRRGARDEIINGIPVHRASPWFTLRSVPVCPEIARHLRRAKPDVIHLHLPNPVAELAVLAAGVNVPLVATYHCEVVRQKRLGALLQPIQQMLLRRAAAILVSSPEVMLRLAPLRPHLDRCHVIPLAVPPAPFRHPNPAEVAQLRARFGSRLVLSVGRLVYYKGFEHLIRAMAHVDGHLVIVGEGPLRGRLEALVSSLGLAGRVTLAGGVEDTAPFYHAAEVFVLASTHPIEAFGIVQLEAMTCGKPVINTWVPTGVSRVSVDQMTGITVPPADPASLAAAITRLLDDPLLRAQYGAAARQRVDTMFGFGAMTGTILELYRRVCGAAQPEIACAERRDFAVTRPAADRSL